jgi:hypothetical protein
MRKLMAQPSATLAKKIEGCSASAAWKTVKQEEIHHTQRNSSHPPVIHMQLTLELSAESFGSSKRIDLHHMRLLPKNWEM